MTFIFETSTSEFNLISNGFKTFDILKFGRSVSVGDTIIYQRVAEADSEMEPDEEEVEATESEIPVQITYLFEDTDGCLKKGYAAIAFKIKE